MTGHDEWPRVDCELTTRQSSLLRVIAGGCCPKVAAGLLQVRLHSYYDARRHLRKKLGANTDAELLVIALCRHLTTLEDLAAPPQDCMRAPRRPAEPEPTGGGRQPAETECP